MDKVPTGVRFFEFLGILSGLALLTIFSWFVKRILRGRKYRRMIARGEIPSSYRVSRTGRLIPPPSALMRAREEKFHGISKEQLDAIAPSFLGPARNRLVDRESSELTKDCTICLEELEDAEAKRILTCGHIFHSHCIEGWAVKQNACPNCRRKLHDEDSHHSTAGSSSPVAENDDRRPSLTLSVQDNASSTAPAEVSTNSSSNQESSRVRVHFPTRIYSPRLSSNPSSPTQIELCPSVVAVQPGIPSAIPSFALNGAGTV